MKKQKQITVSFKSAKQVADFALPFLREGGFFFTTTHDFALGDEVLLKITLPDGGEAGVLIPGEVAFLNPAESTPTTQSLIDNPGVAVAFKHPPIEFSERINRLIAEANRS